MLTVLLLVLATSVMLNAGIVLTRRWHIAVTGDAVVAGSYKKHREPVPRIGGLAIFLALTLGVVLAAPWLYPSINYVFWAMTACVALMFGIGFLEDLPGKVRPTIRYLVCIAAALVFSLANARLGISSVAIPWVDQALAYAPVSVLFFAFAVAGMTHANNLIDGQNGLCAGFSLLAFLALGLAAGASGQVALAALCEIAIAATLGFLLFNFPHGRIFLGDGGAYLNGAVVAILAVLVVNGASGISPWLAVAVLIYPVTETFYSMIRRRREGRPFYEPDDAHLHHLLRDLAVARGWPLARVPALMPLAMMAPFMLAAPFGAHSTPVMLAYCAAFAVLYVAVYRAASASLSKAREEAVQMGE